MNKQCHIEEWNTHYLTCPKCNHTLQNGNPESIKEFYAKHGGGAPHLTDDAKGAYNTLVCPVHNEPLEKQRLTQGECEDEILLGYLFACPRSSKDECDYCLDADQDGNPILGIQELYQYAGLEFGKNKVSDLIDHWTAEREGMRELHQRNTAQANYIRRVEKLIALCIRIATMADHDSSLFSPKLRELINQFNIEQKEMAEDLREALTL